MVVHGARCRVFTALLGLVCAYNGTELSVRLVWCDCGASNLKIKAIGVGISRDGWKAEV